MVLTDLDGLLSPSFCPRQGSYFHLSFMLTSNVQVLNKTVFWQTLMGTHICPTGRPSVVYILQLQVAELYVAGTSHPVSGESIYNLSLLQFSVRFQKL